MLGLFCVLHAARAGGARAGSPIGGYLFAHMLKQDYGRLYYSLSPDGLHWTLVNRGRRVFPEYLGHPNIVRGRDGRFILTGNPPQGGKVRFWISEDLIHWKHLGDALPDMSDFPGYESPGKWHGAPKLFYDADTDRYLLTWHFSNRRKLKEDPENYWSGMRTFCSTSRDLVKFSKARPLLPFGMATIDVIVRKEKGTYYAFIKDERYPSFQWPTGKTIRICSAKRLLGPYTPPGPPVSPNFREAPTLIPRPDRHAWHLYFEQYPGIGYGLAVAPRLAGPWYQEYAPLYRVPEGARHGCMIALTAAEYRALKTAYGSSSLNADAKFQ